MHKGRLEAFSDGVLAIILTIMVLEMKVPHGTYLQALVPLIPVFVSYALSFIYIGIYWNNHHHMFQVVERVSGGVLWANLNLLFWLSLVPFATGWMGETGFSQIPVVLYGAVLLMCAVSYFLLTIALTRVHTKDSAYVRALGRDLKGKLSLLIYLIALALALVAPMGAYALYGLVAIIWLVPDRRMERAHRKS